MTFIKRYPLLTYFVLVFLLAWGGIWIIARSAATGTGDDATMMVALVSLPMLIAPLATAVLLTALLEGKAGLGALWTRMTHWRVNWRWYLFALLVMPLVVLVILVILAALVSPGYTPMLSLLGLAGILAGYLEEFGWTGFATPRLLRRWQPLTAGLVLGVVWGLWHALADFTIRGSTLGAFWPVTFGLFVLPLTAWRIVMVWAYDETHSGVISQIMHFSYTGSLALFIPVAAISPAQDALVYTLLAIFLWAGVAALLIFQRKKRRAGLKLSPQIK